MFRLINSLKNRKGFTLIELIVVLAVLAIIMAIAVPRFLGVKDSAASDSDIATITSVARIAELEFVRLNKTETADKTAAALGINIGDLIVDNFPNGLNFQSKALNGVTTIADADVTFNANGYVKSIKIGSKTYTNTDGKFK